MDFEFGQSDKAKVFFREHPNFWDAFQKLMNASNRCFGRRCHPSNQAEGLMFSLGQTCREDYLEIAFMAAHGFNVARRAVTHAYIIRDPEKVMKFVRFGAIQEYRVMKGALEAGITEEALNEQLSPENSIASITEQRDKVKADFKGEECSVCGMEAPMSWDKHSVGAMAKKAGELYKAMYLGGYAMPNLHVHATLISAVYLEGADEKLAAAVRKREAYSNLGQASAIMLLVMKEQNELFKLGLEDDLEETEKAIAEEWFKDRREA